MVVFALLIINKAGGLIYTRIVSPGLQKLSANDYLILAGTFHGIHAIARSLCPVPYANLSLPSAAPAIFLPSSSSSSTTAGAAGAAGGLNNPSSVPPSTAASTGINNNPDRGPGPQRRPAASGIESLESSHFRLSVRQTPTGTKFLLFTSPDTATPAAEQLARRCYELYALYVMGNPFYSLEMPIRIERFEREVGRVLVGGRT